METLNDVCQLQIIYNLKLTDQLSVFEATKEAAANRWVSNIRYTWQHQLIFSLNLEHFKNFDKKPKLLQDFLSVISETVQELYLDNVTLDNLQCWSKYKFPKMRSLEYVLIKDGSSDSRSEEEHSNLFIQLMAELFPELISIKPHGSFDFIHLTNWMNLRKLDMFDCCPVSKSIESAKGAEGLQMLEELIIYREYLSWEHFKMLISLPKLQSLTLKQPKTDRFSCLIEMRAQDIEKITINGNNLNEILFVKEMINLRHVSLLDVSEIRVGMFQKLLKALPLLERLDIIDSSVFSSEIELWQSIEYCPHLNILYISDVELEKNFYSESRQPMKEALNKRSSSLSLYFNDIGNYAHLISSNLKHRNLKVCFKKLPVTSIYYHNVQLYFYPSTTNLKVL